LNAGFTIAGAYFTRGDSLEFRVEIRDGATDKVLTLLDPIAAPTGAGGEASPLAGRVTAAVGTLGFGRGRGQHWEHGSVATSIAALRAMQVYYAANVRQDWPAAIAAARDAAALDSTWYRAVDALMSAYYNAGQARQLDSVRRAWRPRRFGLMPFDQASFDASVGYDEDQELAYRASQALLSYDSSNSLIAYGAATTAIVTNRPRMTLRIVPLRLRDTTEFARIWPYWADIESWAHHDLGEHEAELAALQQWRATLPQDPMIREREASALIALGRLATVPLLADSALLAPPDGWFYPNVGYVPGILALELRAHGHPDEAPALLEKALGWFEPRTSDPSSTLRARFEQAQVLSWAGRDAAAKAMLERLLAMGPDSARYLGQLGVVAVQLGDRALATRMDQRLAALRSPLLHDLHTLWRANIAAAQGRCAAAVDLLRQSLLRGQQYSLELHRMPYYDPIRGCPAFQALLKPRD